MQKKVLKKRSDTLKEKARNISLKEGSAASFSTGIAGTYITPFALAINSSPLLIGLLSSFTGLASPLSQILGTKFLEKYTRKKLVLLFVLLESFIWLLIGALAILFWKNYFSTTLPYVLLGLFTLLAIFGGISVPSWFSWMGDIVPENERGKYFAKRSTIVGIIGLIGVLIGAFMLDFFKTRGYLMLGFFTLFFLGFTFRFISYLFFRHQYSPAFKLKKRSYFSFFDFIKRYDNFGKFSVYRFFFYLSLMIASPFFTVYMLQELKFGYITFTLITMSGTIFHLIFTPLAGKFSDKFGNLKLIYLGSLLFVLTPLLWLVSKSPIYLIFLPQLVAGLANATITLGFNNFIYDSTSPQHRPVCITYSNLLIGFGTFIGSIVGGLILKNLTITFMSIYFFVFILSSILRFISSIAFLPSLVEYRKVKRLPKMHFEFNHPFKTMHAEIAWFRSVFK